jgi:DNA ligase-1
VEPELVLEVAFNAIMRSDRHDSGYALRFPRIVRIREDKLPKDVDTVEEVERIYKLQHGR